MIQNIILIIIIVIMSIVVIKHMLNDPNGKPIWKTLITGLNHNLEKGDTIIFEGSNDRYFIGEIESATTISIYKSGL